MRIITTIIATLIVLVAIGAVYIWSGAYNVAASEPHAPAVEWLLSTVQSRSVAQRSAGIAPPPLKEQTLIQAGAPLYDHMCRMCHGAPGHDPSKIAQGLNPQAPKLWSDEVQGMSDAELYWIVQHGIKMTGMPAFGPMHKEEELWSVVAFMRRLPALQPEAYSAMVQKTDANHEKGDSKGGHPHH